MGIEIGSYNEYAALLNQCDKELDDIYHDYALKHNLSDAAFWIFYVLYDSEDGLTQAEICDSWFFSRQTVNSALKGLEQQGIIELVAVPGNKKRKNVVFTEYGKDRVEHILSPLRKAENNVFAALSEEENKLLVELTQKRCSLLREFMETE